jgi:DNA-directed RNA polymerase specialized sigma24 family protein
MDRQTSLSRFERDDQEPINQLTDAEREVWDEVETGPYGAREYAEATDRSPGTISNLLRRARETVNGGPRNES